jgi:hypothetical protein
LAEDDPELLFADGFDSAILGVVERAGQDAFVVYDARKCVRILMREGMTREEAEDHFGFNVAGAWVGDRTPGFVWIDRGRDDEDEDEDDG